MKIKEAKTETLKEATIKVNKDLSIDSLVLESLINELELRMEEDEFVSFMDNLDD